MLRYFLPRMSRSPHAAYLCEVLAQWAAPCLWFVRHNVPLEY